MDARDIDSLGRRKTKIVAIDALCSPGMRQYRVDCLLRFVIFHSFLFGGNMLKSNQIKGLMLVFSLHVPIVFSSLHCL